MSTYFRLAKKRYIIGGSFAQVTQLQKMCIYMVTIVLTSLITTKRSGRSFPVLIIILRCASYSFFFSESCPRHKKHSDQQIRKRGKIVEQNHASHVVMPHYYWRPLAFPASIIIIFLVKAVLGTTPTCSGNGQGVCRCVQVSLVHHTHIFF